MYNADHNALLMQIKQLPNSPGVYLFKNTDGTIIYIGKAKNLRARVKSYPQRMQEGFKESQIMNESVQLEHIPTKTELEALLLEAKLIQSHQPKHNVIFREGQPFLWIMITTGNFPELVIVRTRKKKGTYFGPFIDKGPVRKVYDFLIKTFRLRLCSKKIPGGCLYYHLGLCAGSCKDNFDKVDYLNRLDLAKKALQQGHKKFIAFLQEQVRAASEQLEFERARELHQYQEAFAQVFSALTTDLSFIQDQARKDVWVITPDQHELYLFVERDNVLKKKQVFYFPYQSVTQDLFIEYVRGYYRQVPPAGTILVNCLLEDDERHSFEAFLTEWHGKHIIPNIIYPLEGHYAALMRMAIIQAEQIQERRLSLGKSLRALLQLPIEPYSIDCFDVSHKQGMYMVGSCIRFIDGNPAPEFFRRFKIKTVEGQDDYASLRELVTRRYYDHDHFPDVILIDGGKGQLNAVQHLFPDVEFVSLAKREETVYSKRFMEGKVLDLTTYAAQTLIALRDYAHHFAISYHRKLAQKKSKN